MKKAVLILLSILFVLFEHSSYREFVDYISYVWFATCLIVSISWSLNGMPNDSWQVKILSYLDAFNELGHSKDATDFFFSLLIAPLMPFAMAMLFVMSIMALAIMCVIDFLLFTLFGKDYENGIVATYFKYIKDRIPS